MPRGIPIEVKREKEKTKERLSIVKDDIPASPS